MSNPILFLSVGWEAAALKGLDGSAIHACGHIVQPTDIDCPSTSIALFGHEPNERALFDYTQQYPDPYVPRALTFEVPGARAESTGRFVRRSTRTQCVALALMLCGTWASKRSACACSGRS